MRSILCVLLLAGCATGEGVVARPAPTTTLSLAPSAYVALQCPQPGVIGQRYEIFIDGEAVPIVLDARASANAAWYCGGSVGPSRVRLQVSALDDRRPHITPPSLPAPAPRPTVTAMPAAPRVATTLRH